MAAHWKRGGRETVGLWETASSRWLCDLGGICSTSWLSVSLWLMRRDKVNVGTGGAAALQTVHHWRPQITAQVCGRTVPLLSASHVLNLFNAALWSVSERYQMVCSREDDFKNVWLKLKCVISVVPSGSVFKQVSLHFTLSQTDR